MGTYNSNGSYLSNPRMFPRELKEKPIRRNFFAEVEAIDEHSTGVLLFDINENSYQGTIFVIERKAGRKNVRLSIDSEEISRGDLGRIATDVKVNWDIVVSLGKGILLRASGCAQGAVAAERRADEFQFSKFTTQGVTWYRVDEQEDDFGQRRKFIINNRDENRTPKEWVALVNENEIVKFVQLNSELWEIHCEIKLDGIPKMNMSYSISLGAEEEKKPLPHVAETYFQSRVALGEYFSSSRDARGELIKEYQRSILPIEVAVAGFFNAPDAFEVPLGCKVELIRDYSNAHDPNAVLIYVVDHRKPWSSIKVKIGYVPMAQAKLISLYLDTGKVLAGEVVRLNDDYLKTPVIKIYESF